MGWRDSSKHLVWRGYFRALGPPPGFGCPLREQPFKTFKLQERKSRASAYSKFSALVRGSFPGSGWVIGDSSFSRLHRVGQQAFRPLTI